jgi:dihydrofolate reductase
MEIALVAVMDNDKGLGLAGDMPWRGKVPSDMKRFRSLTMGHAVLMGRKTQRSLGGRPLPGRRNIVITRDLTVRIDGVECYTSIEKAISETEAKGEEKLFVIGGGEIYGFLLPRVTTMYLTFINAMFPADTHFPEYDPLEWKMTECHPVFANGHDLFDMKFVTLVRVT